MKNKLLNLLVLLIIFTLSGCKSEPRLILNEKYSEYYDIENQQPTKGILIEYGEVPSLVLDEYLSTKKELLEGTRITVHNMKNEELVEEPIEVKDILDIGDYYLLISDGNEKIQLLISVRDTVMPEFVDFKNNLKFEEGKEVELVELFKAKDLTNTEIKIEGKVDFDKPGEYTIKVIAIDEGENFIEKECIVEITKKPKEVIKTDTTTSIEKPSTNSNPSDDKKEETKQDENKEEVEIPESHYNPSYNQQVLDLINVKRTENGVSELTYNSSLQYIADARAKEVVSDWSHDGLKKYEQQNGCDYGEILAYGYGTPKEVINGWMNSTGHKNAMLADYQLTGTVSSYYDGASNTTYWVVIFTH